MSSEKVGSLFFVRLSVSLKFFPGRCVSPHKPRRRNEDSFPPLAFFLSLSAPMGAFIGFDILIHTHSHTHTHTHPHTSTHSLQHTHTHTHTPQSGVHSNEVPARRRESEVCLESHCLHVLANAEHVKQICQLFNMSRRMYGVTQGVDRGPLSLRQMGGTALMCVWARRVEQGALGNTPWNNPPHRTPYTHTPTPYPDAPSTYTPTHAHHHVPP